MAHGIKNVSTHQPCKICGKPDWCGRYNLPEGYEMHICMRVTNQTDTIGIDGNTYVFIKETSKGNSLYEEYSQRSIRIDNFKSSNYNKKPSATFHKPQMVYENQVSPLSNEKLDAIYRDLLSMLVLEHEHEKYLLNEGWDSSLIRKNNIKTLPEDDYYRYVNKITYHSKNPWRKEIAAKLVLKHGDLTGVPGAFKKNGVWTFAGLGGIIFPIYDSNGNIYRLRTRVDRQYFNSKNEAISASQYELLKVKGEQCYTVGKYHNFSSYKEDPLKLKQGIISNIRDCGCEASNNIGFYMDTRRDDLYLCYVTEGEKKSIIGNHILHAPFINVPGVNSYSKLIEPDVSGKRPIDYLKDLGVQLIVVAFDADKTYNSKVLDSEAKTVEILKSEGFQLAIANWDKSLGKGIDDLLISGGRPSYEFV